MGRRKTLSFFLTLLLLPTWHLLQRGCLCLALAPSSSSSSSSPPCCAMIHCVSFLRPDWKTASAAHRRFWSWKIDVMGLAMTESQYRQQQFAQRIMEYTNAKRRLGGDNSAVVQEVLFISNCQRIEVVLATTEQSTSSAFELARLVTNMLEECVTDWERETNKTSIPVLQLNNGKGDDQQASSKDDNDDKDLPHFVTVTSGITQVARYLCRIAVGMPFETPLARFAPFSSRDAHVLSQLKQAFVAASSVADCNSTDSNIINNRIQPQNQAIVVPPPCRGRLAALMRGSLQVGKRARNPKAVPILTLLQSSSSSSSSSKPSQQEVAKIAQWVLDQVVEPAVVDVSHQVIAVDRGQTVAAFRQRAWEQLAFLSYNNNSQTTQERQQRRQRAIIRRALHAPTMALRQGLAIDEALILQHIADQVHQE